MKPDASYHVLYLGEACESEPQRVRARFLHLIEEFERGVLRPLPYRGFVVDDAVSAFPFMAQARHIGKIVLFDDSAVLHELGDGAVWITGGLGGMGLELGRQFAQRGVRRVVLTSRSEPSPEVLRELEELRARGVDVAVLRGDVGVLSEVERIRDEIEALGWRLDHVVHAAAVLDDAALIRQSWTRFATVLSPKALGAWNLHVATRRLPLRSFVLCSAGAGLLGSPGQAGYAAANGFLDGLAHLRRSEGLPATSIAWGPWANVGMAARAGLDWSDQGLQGIDGPGGMAALLRLKAEEVPTPAVLPTDWRRFPARDADGRPFPLFHLVAGDASVPTAGESAAGWRRQLETPVRIDPSEFAALSPEELSTRLLTYVVSTLASVLRMKADRIHQDTSIAQLGFDSLMAVDFRNRVETDTGVSLTTAAILAAGSPAELASELWEAFDTTTATPTQEVTAGELLTVETFEF